MWTAFRAATTKSRKELQAALRATRSLARTVIWRHRPLDVTRVLDLKPFVGLVSGSMDFRMMVAILVEGSPIWIVISAGGERGFLRVPGFFFRRGF